MRPWKVVSLEIDYPAIAIGDYFEKYFDVPLLRTCRNTRTEWIRHSKKSIINLTKKSLQEITTRKLVVYGSGNFHHYTYGLCMHASRMCQDFGYIHFDHHNDYNIEPEREIRGEIACGTFVKTILEDTNASAALFVGSRPPKEALINGIPHPYIYEEHLRTHSRFNKLERLLKQLPDDVYLSFDLDVMCKSAIITAWDQGNLKIHELMKAISIIKKNKNIIGADILGYGDPQNKLGGKDLYVKIAQSILKS